MKKTKKYVLFLACLFLLVSLFFIVQIYAKYLTQTNSNSAIPIARWKFTVNSMSISNNSDISTQIIPVFPGNDNIASNIIAPTAEGYFDLDIDFSNADVSFLYTITTTVDSNSQVKDFVVTGYSIDDAPKVDVAYNTPYSETILLNSDIENRKVRVYVMWNDDLESSNMDNSSDTLAALSDNAFAIFNVNISFSQITENVTP